MKQFALLDYCTSDYFRGYNRDVVAIPVFYTMTNSEVAQAIKDELNMIEHDFTKTEHLIIDEFIEKLNSEPDIVYVQQDDVLGEFDEPCYMYFSIINPVIKNGLTFLN